MANVIADYLASKINRAVFNDEPFSVDVVYFALYTTAPTSSGGGVEVSGNGYARVAVDHGFSFITNETVAQNLSVIQFPTPTASWGSVVAIGAFDAATGGNFLFAETFGGVAVGLGQAPKVNAAAGAFSIVAGV